jgi:hypothetical protein
MKVGELNGYIVNGNGWWRWQSPACAAAQGKYEHRTARRESGIFFARPLLSVPGVGVVHGFRQPNGANNVLECDELSSESLQVNPRKRLGDTEAGPAGPINISRGESDGVSGVPDFAQGPSNFRLV